MMRSSIARGLIALFPLAGLRAQAPRWTDSSPHQVRGIGVSEGVRLEVLDWGGSGQPVVFLAGLGNTAHTFDDFAPRFRDSSHVYAITRRGFGASSRPDVGYDAATRAQDIVSVLDSLGIGKAVIAGHSIAGDELSKVARTYPDRVRGLIYLDAYDYGADKPSLGLRPPPQAIQPMTSADSSSPRGVAAYLRRTFGVALPEAEMRLAYAFDDEGHVMASLPPVGLNPSSMVVAGTEAADYSRIVVPALAIYAVTESPDQVFPGYESFDAENRDLAKRYLEPNVAWAKRVRDRFRTQMRHGSVLEIPGGNHYVFISHDAQVERAMRDFLARLR